MQFIRKEILLHVIAIAIWSFSGSPARAFWVSFPGVGIEVVGPHGGVNFPGGAVKWGPHGGAVVFPGGKVKWGHNGYRCLPYPNYPHNLRRW